MDPRHPDGFGDGHPGWRLPRNFPNWPADRQDRELWQVLAAASQHHHSYAFTEALNDRVPRLPLKGHCALWGYDHRRMGQVLRGDVVMRHDDWVFALKSLGPTAVASPSDLGEALDFAAETAAAVVGGLKSGLVTTMSRQQAEVMEMMGQGAGAVVLDEALSREETAGLRRNRETAPAYIEQAAQRLRNRPGLHTTNLAEAVGDERLRLVQPAWSPAGADNSVEVDLARWEARDAVARGSADEDGYVVTVWLKVDWATKVHDAGHALLDGWFAADTRAHVHGKPTMARVLDLVPHRGDTRMYDDGAYMADHEFRTRIVAVTWDGDRPSIGRAPEDPSQP